MNTLQLNHREYKTIDQFLIVWDEEYKSQTEKIDLFKSELTSRWNDHQRKQFVRLLYHQRGHFDDILWLIGSFAPDANTKEMILNNIRDEFGQGGRSHEKLYLDFANSMGVDLAYELINEEFYLPFLKDYNQGCLRWMRGHDWNHKLTAFAALERLDNVDYSSLKKVVTSFGLEKIDLVFFDVHIHVQHFDRIDDGGFHGIWDSQPELVANVFNFIGNYQLDIWKKISEAIIASAP